MRIPPHSSGGIVRGSEVAGWHRIVALEFCDIGEREIEVVALAA